MTKAHAVSRPVELIEIELGDRFVARAVFEQFAAQPFACLRFVIVDEPYRGQGFGRMLVAEALRIARARGLTTLGVCSEPDEMPFWQHMGFVANGHSSYLGEYDMIREVNG